MTRSRIGTRSVGAVFFAATCLAGVCFAQSEVRILHSTHWESDGRLYLLVLSKQPFTLTLEGNEGASETRVTLLQLHRTPIRFQNRGRLAPGRPGLAKFYLRYRWQGRPSLQRCDFDTPRPAVGLAYPQFRFRLIHSASGPRRDHRTDAQPTCS